jgi:hypothetical protein
VVFWHGPHTNVAPPHDAQTPPPPPPPAQYLLPLPPPPSKPLTASSYHLPLPSTPVPHSVSLLVCHISHSLSTSRSLTPILHSSSSRPITILPSHFTLSPPDRCPTHTPCHLHLSWLSPPLSATNLPFSHLHVPLIPVPHSPSAPSHLISHMLSPMPFQSPFCRCSLPT